MQGVGPFCETPSPRSSNLSGLVRSEKNLYDERESRKAATAASRMILWRTFLASIGVDATIDAQDIVIEDGVDTLIDDQHLIGF